ncbi:beta-galactosidase beta subunit [Neobacillus sp. B4I6]|uniref:hypothetical protein n=1 Tax=Neobacillus sp. B4I6 TaxID=3373925 RepID=UPI003D1C6116
MIFDLIENLDEYISLNPKIANGKGMAYICLPHDGHKALKYIDQATKYNKAVIKVEI